MRHTLTIVLLLLATAVGMRAQQVLVTGTVTDQRTGRGIELATVQLLRPDSSFVSGANTDSIGLFKIPSITAGKYIVKASYVGFGTATKDITVTTEHESMYVGKISLDGGKDVLLGVAEVKATLARVEQKEDTTVFNATAFRTPEGSTLEALVKQLPGVEIDDDGKITWNGKEVKEFLVNGKDFFKGDTQTAMKNLPVDLVSKLKAYDKQSDYAEQTGIDDGEETTVLDIMTKRELNESWITNIDLAYGTKDRYAEKFFATRFTDNSRVTAFGSANNIGDRGFGGPRGFGGGGGLTASKMAGLDFSWENGKAKREQGRFEVGGNVRYNHTSTDAVTTSASETFLTSGAKNSFSNRHSISGSSSTNVNSSLRLQWNPDSMTNVTLRPSFTHSSSHNSGNSRTATFNDDPFTALDTDNTTTVLDSIFASTVSPELALVTVNRNLRNTLSDSKSNAVSANLNIIRRLNSKGRNVSLRASGGYTKSESNAYTISDITYFQDQDQQGANSHTFLNQYSMQPSKEWNSGVRLGYVEPIVKNLYAEVRYDYSYRYTNSDRSRYNLEALYGNTDVPQSFWNYGDPDNYPPIGTVPTESDVLGLVLDRNNSQYATYKYSYHSATVGIRYNAQKLRFNAGLSFNPERTTLEYNRPAQLDTTVVRTVFNISPQVRLRYQFDKTTRLEVNYRGSSSQPSMTNLLNVVDNSDPLNISMGNPGLKPAWTDRMRVMYNGYNADKQMGLMAGGDFTSTRNSISNLMVYDENTGVRYTRPENISGDWSGNARFMLNAGLGKQKLFTITTFSNVGYQNSVGYVSTYDRGGRAAVDALATRPLFATTLANDVADYSSIFDNANAQKNNTKTLSLNEHLDLAYRASWFDVSLNGNVRYQHSRSKLQEAANMDVWNYVYGASANFNLNWGMSLSTDLRMTSRRGYAESSMNTNELIWNAQISQSFLRAKNLTVMLQFYDILHQQSNVSRTINAQMRSDSWTNAINSYCMVHVIYKLNIFNGSSKSNKQQDEPRGPGMGDRRMGPPPGGGMMGGGRFGGRGPGF